jgi:hypothetical protein
MFKTHIQCHIDQPLFVFITYVDHLIHSTVSFDIC